MQGLSWVLMACVGNTAAAAQPADIRFNEHIRPIFAEHCLACHGPDSASRKADLRLDRRHGALTRGAIVPGRSADSELIERIMSDDPDLQMPPPDSRNVLSTLQKQLLVRWINEGAKWEKHWSFIPPRRPALPERDSAESWGHNPIDHFVLARLQPLGLSPNEPADRHTLVPQITSSFPLGTKLTHLMLS